MKYCTKPCVIEAEQFTDENKDRCFNFVTCTREADFDSGRPVLRIQTLEGEMTARIGDWIVKGVLGEFYPCKPEAFERKYEPLYQSAAEIMQANNIPNMLDGRPLTLKVPE
jgi:hypothetical protein